MDHFTAAFADELEKLSSKGDRMVQVAGRLLSKGTPEQAGNALRIRQNLLRAGMSSPAGGFDPKAGMRERFANTLKDLRDGQLARGAEPIGGWRTKLRARNIAGTKQKHYPMLLSSAEQTAWGRGASSASKGKK